MNRNPQFRQLKKGSRFNIDRPAYDAGTKTIKEKDKIPDLKPMRKGKLDLEGDRPSFKALSVEPRKVIPFEKLQEQQTKQFGQKVQLGEETLKKLFQVEVADPDDRAWIAEKARLVAAGRPNDLPFGREQRKIKKMINFGQANISTEDKINAVAQAVQQGRAESQAERAALGAQVANLIANANAWNAYSQQQRNVILGAIQRLNIPANYRQAGLPQRLYDLNEYLNNAGLINLFLLSNLPQGRTIQFPLIQRVVQVVGKNVRQRETQKSLTYLYQMGPDPTRGGSQFVGGGLPQYLDVQNRMVIGYPFALDLAQRGVDGGQLSGQPVPAPAGINPATGIQVLPRQPPPLAPRAPGVAPVQQAGIIRGQIQPVPAGQPAPKAPPIPPAPAPIP